MSSTALETRSGRGLSFVRPDLSDDELVLTDPASARRGREFVQWRAYEGGVYQVEVRLEPESGGGFSVHVPELPGVVSQGETQQEAEENIREALAAAIESYRESHEEIPWRREPVPTKPGENSRWIVVHV